MSVSFSRCQLLISDVVLIPKYSANKLSKNASEIPFCSQGVCLTLDPNLPEAATRSLRRAALHGR